MTISSEALRSPWWAPSETLGPSNPIFSVSLFGLSNRRLDVGATILLLAVIVFSRTVAFPASIWEQDEAYFAAAVVDFDATANHPHPPWFPLWIGLGKVVHLMVDDPARALQIVSWAASLWVIFPLTALFNLWLRRDLAIAGSLLYLFTPSTLFLSSRAFSGPLATALLAASLAFWLRNDGGARGGATGSIMAGCCLLVRPHLVPAVAAIAVYRMVISKSRRERLSVSVPLAALVLGGFALVAIDAGGLGPLQQAMTEHRQYHFGSLAGATLQYSEMGLARAFLLPALAVLWSGLVILGFALLFRQRTNLPAGVVAAFFGLLPIVVAVAGFSYAGNVRYFLPIVALGSGFAVLGMAALCKGWTTLFVTALCLMSFVAAQPALGEYRRFESPAVQGVSMAMHEAGQRGAVIVADRTLAAFFDYQRSRADIPFTVLFDSQIGSETIAPPPFLTVAVFDAVNGDFVADAESMVSFEVGEWWLSRLSQGRFLRITVASGAVIKPPKGRFDD